MSRIPPEFQVKIPEVKTAQYPADHRSDSKLLIVDRKNSAVFAAGKFSEIIKYIAGDLIVINDTKVVPARVEGRRAGGGRAEVLFLTVAPCKTSHSEVHVETLISPGRRLKPGKIISLPGLAELTLIEKEIDGKWQCLWSCEDDKLTFNSWLNENGTPPLPPYIHRKPEASDHNRYQTVYANDPGSLAAPTAGLHFTTELMSELENNGCEITRLTLDVGLGTFLPIRDENITEHQMHTEAYNIPDISCAAINSTLNSDRRLTVVGTTVVRALEAAAATKGLPLGSGEGIADIFIYPPYQFKIIDRLLTNFHRPDSTLLQLIASLIGWDMLNLAYQTALNENFRFYSYGDAMLII
ncbi:MAG: tRNA preQ1(34) S-adenosylmethionine ribosyltransferase-isomerase QueA [Calditrichaeota bacterium]|nr:tRNA preQ1(34) S-adenosylmethionine ribosyltransferase-isomerase QueA [Calditrichota bacterium]